MRSRARSLVWLLIGTPSHRWPHTGGGPDISSDPFPSRFHFPTWLLMHRRHNTNEGLAPWRRAKCRAPSLQADDRALVSACDRGRARIGRSRLVSSGHALTENRGCARRVSAGTRPAGAPATPDLWPSVAEAGLGLPGRRHPLFLTGERMYVLFASSSVRVARAKTRKTRESPAPGGCCAHLRDGQAGCHEC